MDLRVTLYTAVDDKAQLRSLNITTDQTFPLCGREKRQKSVDMPESEWGLIDCSQPVSWKQNNLPAPAALWKDNNIQRWFVKAKYNTAVLTRTHTHTHTEATAGTTNRNPSRIKERASLFWEKMERFLDLQFATPVPKVPTLLRSLFITHSASHRTAPGWQQSPPRCFLDTMAGLLYPVNSRSVCRAAGDD